MVKNMDLKLSLQYCVAFPVIQDPLFCTVRCKVV